MKKTLFILTLVIFGLIINQSCKKQDEELKMQENSIDFKLRKHYNHSYSYGKTVNFNLDKKTSELQNFEVTEIINPDNQKDYIITTNDKLYALIDIDTNNDLITLIHYNDNDNEIFQNKLDEVNELVNFNFDYIKFLTSKINKNTRISGEDGGWRFWGRSCGTWDGGHFMYCCKYRAGIPFRCGWYYV